MKALYRRYRPKALEEVVGQPQITETLTKSLKNGKIAHSYLFIGPRGCGKTSVARILAHAINDFKYELEDEYLDIIEIDAASNRGIENIRELRERVSIAPTKGKYKVYIIDEVHMLTKEAFNALLKTLEEPPEHVVFIMATTDADKVPITITSRSQIYTFKLADPSTMFEHIKNIAKKEKINITDEAIKVVVKRGGGSFRDTLSILDQLAITSDEKITEEFVNHCLGLPQDEILKDILNAYLTQDAQTIHAKLKELNEAGIKPESISNGLINAILENPEPSFLPLLDKLTEPKQSTYPQIRLLVALLLPKTSTVVLPAAAVAVAPAPAAKVATPVAAPTSAPVPTPEAKPEPSPAPNVEAKPEPIEAASAPSAENIQPIAPVRIATTENDDELWNQIMAKLLETNKPTHSLLEKVGHALDGKTLTIYTGGSFGYKTLDKRRGVIAEILPEGYELALSAEKLIKDQSVADIAALMGGGEEVTIDE